MEHGKRGGQAVRERDMLRAVMERLHFACSDCPTRSYKIEWNAVDCRYILAIYHDPECWVMRDDYAQRSCSEFMKNAMRSKGLALPEYDNDGRLIEHRV